MNKTYLCFLVIVLPVLVMHAGCATQPAGYNSNVRPDITIHGTTQKEVVNALVANSMSRGFQVVNATDYSVTTETRNTNLATALFFGSRYDSQPAVRVHYNVAQTSPELVRVNATAAIVTNPGSAFERITDVTNTQAANLLSILNSVRQSTGKEGVQIQQKNIGRGDSGSIWGKATY